MRSPAFVRLARLFDKLNIITVYLIDSPGEDTI